MKRLVLLLLTVLIAVPGTVQGQPAPGASHARLPVKPPAAKTSGQPSQTPEQRAATMGDLSGGRFIPPPILTILADPRIDPNIAYILWQTARKPIADWTLNELFFVTQTAPTLVGAGIPTDKLQALYQFLGLDPADLFSPKLGRDWQSNSTAFDPRSSTNVGAISSTDCQTDPGTMTVAKFQACTGGAQ
jgi:hypothetical protein